MRRQARAADGTENAQKGQGLLLAEGTAMRAGGGQWVVTLVRLVPWYPHPGLGGQTACGPTAENQGGKSLGARARLSGHRTKAAGQVQPIVFRTHSQGRPSGRGPGRTASPVSEAIHHQPQAHGTGGRAHPGPPLLPAGACDSTTHRVNTQDGLIPPRVPGEWDQRQIWEFSASVGLNIQSRGAQSRGCAQVAPAVGEVGPRGWAGWTTWQEVSVGETRPPQRGQAGHSPELPTTESAAIAALAGLKAGSCGTRGQPGVPGGRLHAESQRHLPEAQRPVCWPRSIFDFVRLVLLWQQGQKLGPRS